jgi:hypothetical protein
LVLVAQVQRLKRGVGLETFLVSITLALAVHLAAQPQKQMDWQDCAAVAQVAMEPTLVAELLGHLSVSRVETQAQTLEDQRRVALVAVAQVPTQAGRRQATVAQVLKSTVSLAAHQP